MKFWLLLWALGLRMMWLAWRNPKFGELLVDKSLVLQFQTRDEGVVRHYVVNNGRITMHGGGHASPSAVISFRDGDYAVTTLMSGGKDPMAFMKGVQAQDISIKGDYSVLMWFMSVAKFLPPKRRKTA